ncbi:MAG: excinuclease ABC subunit C [Sphingomonadales bacterium 35-56-22]|jgi:excinuclease ABC subunit C|uniref:excinuclease ABC subunit UvrC n=2 Tax=Sphingorhabdus sp. TaxID=1902408 RepID=UPI000BCFA4A2|nr:excinuclease ABC subunit UvrC [Sphingorhabdus sp.]OYY14658.1 MAG: excinuclease ABC subunit C [Sphingomonadales bacterium 35-56-22]OYY98443.1 MAG: excinuclease ABC subunit C [Sphingomonadales bacterium 28-56-43]OYZ59703.1 MAG: excinuclease ABC subunit C [Sphingomonadales bacterium 24-56-14]OZA82055.1 MAG: excinuclease ABC subunit C [Sphingomonadales bacterium 39-57-19]HQS12123.1 excinuclease ABC subunit UvrC [Sphingorhabdus sp.]
MSKADRPDQPNAASRFNEEQATYAVRGADTPDLETGTAAIRNVLKTLPLKPGVYRMHDARGEILYVGKARALKNRVGNYVQIDRLPNRLRRMVALTRSMTIVTTNSEAEALLLEAQLIKRYRPAYNVLLRDDKSFPFILLRADHKFPRIQKHRGARRNKGHYYGPFASAGSVNQTLNALQKLFLLRSCSDSFFNNRDRPCLLYQIKRCSAPCVGRIDDQSYDGLVADAKSFLDGKSSDVQAKLAKEMEGAAEALDFERAAMLRDRLKALTFIQGSQAINAQGVGDADIFALAHRNGVMGIQAFFIRGGQNWGHRSFFPSHVAEMTEDEVFTSFLAQFYEDVAPAKNILLDRELTEADLLAEALSERAERKIEISVPQRGDRVRLVKQATRNAEEALDRRLAESTTQGKLLQEVADLFELPEPPRRIEIYDNSHIQGSNALGAMVVAGPEGFIKGQYRKFNIKQAATDDDFAMMREVFQRRFARAQEDDPDRDSGQWPDLVLIDGGKGQMSSVKAALEEIGVDDVPLIAIAKGPHHGRDGREVFHFPDGRELTLPVNAPVLFYLQRLRDEVHRYAIGAHRAKRSKAITVSPLDEVPGIGPSRKKALLLHFGTARAVRNASLEDLQKAPGVSAAVAQTVYDFYHAGG